MSVSGELTEYLIVTGATVLSVGGVGLLFVGAYLTGFGLKGVISVVGGIILFTVGILSLLRRDSTVSDRLVDCIKEVFLNT